VWFGDFLIELIGSLYLEGQRPVYVQSPICVRVCSIDLRRITLVLMHNLIQPPSSYKSSFSYKTSDGAETHDPSTHATGGEWQVASDTLCMSRYECVSHAAGIGADRDRPVRCLQSVVQSGLRFC